MADQQVKVRRKTPRSFAMVPHAFARDNTLSDKAFRLWIVLQSHADFDDRDCQLFQETLTKELACSRASIWRAQTELVERQLLEIESGKETGSPNVYTVLDPPEGYRVGEIPPIALARDPVFHQRDTGCRVDARQGVASTRDKENENYFNEIGDAVTRPVEIPTRIAEVRDRITAKAVGE